MCKRVIDAPVSRGMHTSVAFSTDIALKPLNQGSQNVVQPDFSLETSVALSDDGHVSSQNILA